MAAPARYQRQHFAVVDTYGKASEWDCDCGKPAAHWSLRHGADPDVVSNYDPKCVKCHSAYDRPSDRHPMAKLKVEDVLAIRKAHSEGAKQVELAAQYGVGPEAISKIVRRERWANV